MILAYSWLESLVLLRDVLKCKVSQLDACNMDVIETVAVSLLPVIPHDVDEVTAQGPILVIVKMHQISLPPCNDQGGGVRHLERCMVVHSG